MYTVLMYLEVAKRGRPPATTSDSAAREAASPAAARSSAGSVGRPGAGGACLKIEVLYKQRHTKTKRRTSFRQARVVFILDSQIVQRGGRG